MGAGALFVDLVRRMLRRRALVPAEMRALKWGVLRMLGLVDPPVQTHPRDPSLLEEVFLDEALQQTRKVMAQHPEENMTPEHRYARMEIPYSAAGPDGGDIRILSEEEAKRIEASTALRRGERMKGVEKMGSPFKGPDRRMSWNSARDVAPTDSSVLVACAPKNETDQKKE